MFPTLLRRYDAKTQRWLVVTAIGASMAVGMLGMLDAPTVRKLVSAPFPCQHHRCGCHDAASCWQSCCCMNDAEKLAWAKEHGVTPPAAFRKRISKENLFRPRLKVVAKRNRKAPRGCCSHDACAPSKAGNEPGFAVVQISAYRCCAGLAPLFKILASAVCESSNGVWQPSDRQVARVCLPTAVYRSRSYAPPTPPPRLHIGSMQCETLNIS